MLYSYSTCSNPRRQQSRFIDPTACGPHVTRLMIRSIVSKLHMPILYQNFNHYQSHAVQFNGVHQKKNNTDMNRELHIIRLFLDRLSIFNIKKIAKLFHYV